MGWITNLIPGISGIKLAAYGLVAALVVGGAGYLWWHNHTQVATIAALKASNGALTQDVSKVAGINSDLSAANSTLQAQNAADEGALALQASQASQYAGETATAIQSASDAPKAASGGAAPVLLNTLHQIAVDQGQAP